MWMAILCYVDDLLVVSPDPRAPDAVQRILKTKVAKVKITGHIIYHQIPLVSLSFWEGKSFEMKTIWHVFECEWVSAAIHLLLKRWKHFWLCDHSHQWVHVLLMLQRHFFTAAYRVVRGFWCVFHQTFHLIPTSTSQYLLICIKPWTGCVVQVEHGWIWFSMVSK